MLKTNYFHEGHWGQCLELLSHLCQYGDNVLLVTGPSGIGKSALKQALIASEEDKFAICEVTATISLNAEMISEMLDAQIELQDTTRDLLLLIDDAQNLSLDLVATLLQLPQKISFGNLHIVLFASKEFEQKINRSILKEDFYDHVHTIEIEPLTMAEVETFLMHQWRKTGKDVEFLAENVKFKKIYSMSDGIPGKVQQIAEELMANDSPATKADVERHIGLSPLTVGVTVSFGILFCILALLWPAADDNLLSQQRIAVDTLTETLPDEIAGDLARESTQEPTQEPEQQVAQEATPEAVEATPAPVPQVAATEQSAPAPLVMSDDEKIKRLEQKLAGLQQQLQTEKDARQATEVRFQQMLQKQIASKPAVRKPEIAPKPTALSFTNNEEHLLSMPSSNFTLQLMGSNSERKVKSFIATNQLTDKAHYYKGSHKGRPWYVVVYGNYPSKLEAQEALAKLPSPLKRLHPWPRQYVKIHNSIKKQSSND